jgi:hypothetical protein
VRASRVKLASVSLLVWFGLCAPSRADDWLALFPECDAASAATPRLELLYPQSGLPAVVTAGDSLIVRLRLPAALTPPPGVQQERALDEFSAELSGEGMAIGKTVAVHRHALAVLALRPDSGSSLVYRMRLAIPAYVAPGSYRLRVQTPFGVRELESAVRVIAAGASIRVARLPSSLPADAMLATLPVDIWLTSDHARLPESPLAGLSTQPQLALNSRLFALRVGNELWLAGACRSPAPGFASELSAILRAEHLSLRRLELESLPPTAAEPGAWLRAPARIELRADGFSFDNHSGRTPLSVSLLLPAAASLRVVGAELALYPATDLSLSEVRTIAGRLEVAAGQIAQLSVGPAAITAADYALEPLRVRAGRESALHVRGAGDDARVAFDYGFARSALLGPELKTRFAGPLEAPVRALLLPRTGGARLLRARLLVEPSRPPNCQIGRTATFLHSSATWLVPLFALLSLLKRRGCRAFGNKLRLRLRSEQGHGVTHATIDHPLAEPRFARRALRV